MNADMVWIFGSLMTHMKDWTPEPMVLLEYGRTLRRWGLRKEAQRLEVCPRGAEGPRPSLSLAASWLLLCYHVVLPRHGPSTKEPLATDWESRTMDQNKTFILLSLFAQTSGHGDANLTERPVL